MAVASFLLGRKAVAYFNDEENKLGGKTQADVTDWLDRSTPTTDGVTQPAKNLVDVTLNINSEYADATTREEAESGFATSVPVLKGGEVTFEARWKADDPDTVGNAAVSFTKALMNAWENDGQIGMVFLDQPWSTAEYDIGDKFVCQGLAANFNVSMSKMEPLRDVQRMSVSLTIADTGTWFRSAVRERTS